MIADKMYPSFYLLELEGNAVGAILPGDFGIHKIAIGSTDYQNDMLAHGGLERAMRFFSAALSKTSDVTEEIKFNPEFFPTLNPLELTEEQQLLNQQVEEAAEEMQDTLEGTNQIVVPLTNSFDPVGDFVSTRWTLKTDDARVEGRVAIQPQYYLLEKRMDSTTKSDPVKVH